uniref:Ig-like domain-containing protein n=1 Tax=Periophthalmus magnuspinnatus TaxID=409849 RepID=A0A3B3ZQC5_9GOBI
LFFSNSLSPRAPSNCAPHGVPVGGGRKACSILRGEVARFHACVSGMPQPEVTWFHNRHKLHMHSTCLVIDCIKEKDSGSYKVMAINTEGSAESTASLLVSLRGEQSANYLGFAKRSGHQLFPIMFCICIYQLQRLTIMSKQNF